MSEFSFSKLLTLHVSTNKTHLIFQACEAHLPSGQEVSSHYKAVCRALVTEAQELVTFLETISVERHVSRIFRYSNSGV